MALDYRSEYQRYRRYYTYLGPIIKSPVFRAYFSLVLSLFTIAVFLAFAIRPTVATIVGLRKQIEEKQDLNRRLDEKINALSQLQSDYQAIERDLLLVLTALPEDPDVTKAVIFLERVATVSGIVFKNVTMAKADYKLAASVSGVPVASAAAEKLSLMVDFSGDFDKVKTFLGGVIRLSRLFSPVKTTITSSLVDKELEGRTDLNIFYLP